MCEFACVANPSLPRSLVWKEAIMSKRKISCLSAASALVLAYGWSGAVLADTAQGTQPTAQPPAVESTMGS